MSNLRTVLWAITGIVFYCACEETIFGSGWYSQFLDPNSSAGNIEFMLHVVADRPPSTVPEIAVMGNSMLGEGFSPKIADAEAAGRVRFRNLSVPASSPRCWYYFLRSLKQQGRHYRAIVLPVEEFSDEDGYVPRADAIIDTHLVASLLKPADGFDFALSYRDPRLRFEALRGALLKGYIFKLDVQAFLENPAERMRTLQLNRANGAAWIYDYTGRSETLAGLKVVDWERGLIEMPAGISDSLDAFLRQTLLRTRAPHTGEEAAYRQRWFGRILELDRSAATRIIFVRAPRGPAVNPAFDSPNEPSTIRGFASRPNVNVLRPETFQSLERPEYFFDAIHMNRLGRERFSRMLAHEVEGLLAAKEPR